MVYEWRSGLSVIFFSYSVSSGVNSQQWIGKTENRIELSWWWHFMMNTMKKRKKMKSNLANIDSNKTYEHVFSIRIQQQKKHWTQWKYRS